MGPSSARQWASVALCAALGLLLVLPYGYHCALTRAPPVRSVWAIGVRSALLILCASVWHLVGPQCLSSGASSGAIVGHLVCCSACLCYPQCALGYPLAILSALHCAVYMLRCAPPPLGRTSTTRHTQHYLALSQCYPFALTFIRKLIRNDVTGVGGF